QCDDDDEKSSGASRNCSSITAAHELYESIGVTLFENALIPRVDLIFAVVGNGFLQCPGFAFSESTTRRHGPPTNRTAAVNRQTIDVENVSGHAKLTLFGETGALARTTRWLAAASNSSVSRMPRRTSPPNAKPCSRNRARETSYDI